MRRSIWLLVAALLSASPAGAVDLRFGLKGLPSSFGNPYAGAYVSPGNFVWSAIFDGLTCLDKNGTIAPALATRWKVLSPTSWEFSLRRGVVFSNGEPFNAQAVIANFNWLRSPEGARSITANEIRNVTSVEAIDDFTVVLHTAKPDAILPARLSSVMIVAPAAWADLGPDGFSQSPAGTGPFAVKSWGNGAKATLAAHVDSWRKPKVDRLILANLPESAARLAALVSGQIDVAEAIGVDDLDAVESAGMITAVGSGMAVTALALRQIDERNPALKDVRVRQALNYAVDKDAINKALLRDLGPPSGQPAARGVVGYNPDVAPYPYDPAKAKALLAEAGYPNGFPLRFDVMVDRVPADRAVYETVAQSLAKIGVQLELRTMTQAAWTDAYTSGGWDRDTDGFLLTMNSGPYNDVARVMEIYSCLRPNGFTCDESIAAKLIASNEEMDPDKRLAALNELAQLYHAAAPAIYLNEQFDLYGISRKVEGFVLANRAPLYERMSVKN